MSEMPDVTTRKPGLVVVAIVAIALATAGFLWYAHQRDTLQRQNAARVAQQTQATQALQQSRGATAAWQLTRRVPLPLQRPIALAWRDRRTYVVGSGGVGLDRLLVFDGNDQLVQSVSLPGMPRAVAVTKSVIAVGFGARVALFDVSGKRTADFAVGDARTRLSSLLFVGNELWAADSGQRLIWRLTRDGRALGKLGAANPATGYSGLLAPSPHLDLALTQEGRILVNNPGKQRVEIWNNAGKLLGQFGKVSMQPDGFCGCCNPIAVAALPDGRFVTAEKGLVRVKVTRADGVFESMVAEPPVLSRGTDGLDVATTATGEVLVLDPRARTLMTFAENRTPGSQ